MTVIDLDLEFLRQLAGTVWLMVVGLAALVLLVLTVLLPLFVWRIWWWTRATCRETARLNEKIEHLLTWLIAVRRKTAGEAGAAEEFSFEVLPGARPGESPGGEEDRPGKPEEEFSATVPLSEDAVREDQPDSRLRCSHCGGILPAKATPAERPGRCPSCHAPVPPL